VSSPDPKWIVDLPYSEATPNGLWVPSSKAIGFGLGSPCPKWTCFGLDPATLGFALLEMEFGFARIVAALTKLGFEERGGANEVLAILFGGVVKPPRHPSIPVGEGVGSRNTKEGARQHAPITTTASI
jgi:hypothetical protein